VSVVRRLLKRLWFGLTGRDPDGVVVVFLSGEPARAVAMLAEVRGLVPGRRLFAVRRGAGPPIEGATLIELPEAGAGELWLALRRRLAGLRIALAPTLFDHTVAGRELRRAAWLMAPRKILAYNARLERRHLRLSEWLAGWLFLGGVPLDRIYLRPRRLFPFWGEPGSIPQTWRLVLERGFREGFPRVAILSPYLPWPLAHGGAVRLHALLKETAREFDIVFFGFEDGQSEAELAVLRPWCARLYTAAKPRYREPRWASLLPPEVCEFRSAGLRAGLRAALRELNLPLLQAEYTQMAWYGGDVLVEHDVTADLFAQVAAREGTLRARWDLWRWRRFERAAVRRFRHVVVMSGKDRALLGVPHATVVPNGVDLERFRVEPEPAGAGVLFVGSFRHFPNVSACRLLLEEIWPRVLDLKPEAELTIVAGPEPELYWTPGTLPPGVRLLGYVADVQRLYAAANVVVIPTVVSAGTNLKALEAMASGRAIVSTPSGVAGLGLVDGEAALIAEAAPALAEAIRGLLEDPLRRATLAARARRLAEARYGWPAIAARQMALWRGEPAFEVRPMEPGDLAAVAAIQAAAPEAAQWAPADYLGPGCEAVVATLDGDLAGFLVCRRLAEGEWELLNLAVDPARRRRGLARRLLAAALAGRPGDWYLEVRAANAAARKLYESIGFRTVQLRQNYYHAPPDDGIVMKF
jgi:ribosomal protein S18 acetylase RimI-like enzyme